MKNEGLVRAMEDSAKLQHHGVQAVGIELLDREIDDVAGGDCNGFSCGVYSAE